MKTNLSGKLNKLYNRDYYQQHEYSYINPDRSDVSRMLELLKVKKEDVILDVGCGLGLFLTKVKSRKKFGTETNMFAINECKKRGINAVFANVEKRLPYKNNYFDIVSMNEVIPCLKNPDRALRECFRVLRPKGKIILTTQVKSFFFHDVLPTHYFTHLSPLEFRSLVEKSGFRIISHEACGISFLYPVMENLFFKPFRIIRQIFIKNNNNAFKAIDSLHNFADNRLLNIFGRYRRCFLSFGLNQIILAEKVVQ